jgi:ribosome-associated protein
MSYGRDKLLQISDKVSIPLAELSFRFSRSSGPGGQHASRTETRVELVFDLARSLSLSKEQRDRALRALTSYLDQDGVMHLVSQSTRSQLRNRQEVVERFRTAMQKALRVPKKRYPTAPTRAAAKKRLREKRRRSETKKQRGPVPPGSE